VGGVDGRRYRLGKPINQELWGLEVEDMNGMAIPIQMEDVSEKEFYVLCQISLIFCLSDREAEAREYARKARAVQSVDVEFLITLIARDIQRLKRHQVKFGTCENGVRHAKLHNKFVKPGRCGKHLTWQQSNLIL
jgi:hypothetical protein